MTKKIAVAAAVLIGFLLLPVAIGDFVDVAPAYARVPEPGTLVLLTVGLVGMAASRFRRGC